MFTLQMRRLRPKSTSPKSQIVEESTRDQILDPDSKDCLVLPWILLLSGSLI